MDARFADPLRTPQTRIRALPHWARLPPANLDVAQTYLSPPRRPVPLAANQYLNILTPWGGDTMWNVVRAAAVMALALWMARPARAGALEDGLAAKDQGNFAAALRLLKPLADRGNASAQYEIGWMYYCGWGVPKDDRQAAQWYRKAGDQGDADAQLNLGLMYQDGQGVPKNDAEATRWLRKAADRRVAVAQFQIGWMYDNGQGVQQSNAEAMRWYRRAADQRVVAAQFNLGIMYATGQGVPKDYAEAARWYRKAADQGDATAQFNLGVMYRDGEGVPQDYDEAVQWFRKAATLWKASAMTALGGMYQFGEGAPKDQVLAYMWDNLAAARGSSMGAKNRDVEAARMTPDQIAEAQRLSRECQNQLLNLEDCNNVVPIFLVPDQAQIEVSLVKDGGTFKVPVLINGCHTAQFHCR